MPGREGLLFVDINATDWNYREAEIIQLAAVKLSMNPPDYDGYACPRGEVQSGPYKYHKLKVNGWGQLLRDGWEVDDYFERESDLIHSFGEWIERRYDAVYVIYHAAWHWSLLQRKMNTYKEEDSLAKMKPIPLDDIFAGHKRRLKLHDLSMKGIFASFGLNVSRDAYDNAKRVRECCMDSAAELNRGTRGFLLAGYNDEHRLPEEEADLQAALLISAEESAREAAIEEAAREAAREAVTSDDFQRRVQRISEAVVASMASTSTPRPRNISQPPRCTCESALACGNSCHSGRASQQSTGAVARVGVVRVAVQGAGALVREEASLAPSRATTSGRRKSGGYLASANTSTDSNNNGSGFDCRICFYKIQEFCAFLPCGHACLCHKCALQIHKEQSDCPFCRKSIKAVQKIYFN